MKKGLMIAVDVAALGLAGCVAVPAYDAPYGYGPQVYIAPPAVVVRPAFYGRFGYYGGRGHGYYR
jgi:hypothetical protein